MFRDRQRGRIHQENPSPHHKKNINIIREWLLWIINVTAMWLRVLLSSVSPFPLRIFFIMASNMEVNVPLLIEFMFLFSFEICLILKYLMEWSSDGRGSDGSGSDDSISKRSGSYGSGSDNSGYNVSGPVFSSEGTCLVGFPNFDITYN